MAQEDFIPLEEASSSTPNVKSRKERVNTTVFISSLPYNATSTDLITHFSFLGPVRHGFVATDKESGKSKGVGYVTYVLKEDAEKAVEELDGGEFGDKGRKIRVAWADARPFPGVEVERPKKKPRVTAEEATTHDPNAIRTLVLSGLPNDLSKAVLWKKVRKVDDSVELVFPVEGEANTAHLVFPAHNAALKGLPKLHGHTYKGSLLSCVLKKRLEKLSATGEGRAPTHAGRLIVRNLSWDTTEQDLRATFLPYGPIHSVNLPTLPTKLPHSDSTKPAPPPRARGFAFVWFLTRKDAETAIQAVNGKVIKKAGEGKGKGQKADHEGRPVAVDFALSKEKWKETQADDVKPKVEEDAESSSAESSSASSSGSSSGSSGGESDGEDEEDGGEDEDDEEDKKNVVKQEINEEPVTPHLPAVDVGSTLFIRNLPFEATEPELTTLFRSFGPLRYARITIDKSTGRSRGTGFVCFWNTEHADKAIEEAEKVAQETGANTQPLGGNNNPFVLPSVLTADPSSSLVSRLVIHGRTLEVQRAVTREEAGQKKEDGERARHTGDKRNTYLMREGVIFPNSQAASSLPEAELAKRQESFNARRTLLRSNPSLYISKTRLSIRQLPLFVTDRTLKRLGIHAVRAFDDEIRSESREPLSRIEEQDSTLSGAVEGKSKKRGERETAVVQSKVVRQAEKVDPLTGMGKSKGYGFLEMRSHKDALKVLRYANNNAEVGPLLFSWWKVEMADVLERTKKTLAAFGDSKVQAESKEDGEVEEGKGRGKEKESKEELEARIKRLEGRLAEGDERSGGGMRGGKTLLIEFSIENVQVVRRRVEKIVNDRNDRVGGVKRKAEDSDEEKEGKALKKPREAKRNEKDKGSKRNREKGGKQDGDKAGLKKDAGGKVEVEREKRGIEKLGANLGSMIGRKRKMRKGGK